MNKKQIKENIGFADFLNNKAQYFPYSINVESINEDFVLSDDFERAIEGIEELSFLVNDPSKEIKEYMGLLAFLNIVKAKSLIPHSNIYLEVEYKGKDTEDVLTSFYEKLNLWNIRVLIKLKDHSYRDDYVNYISGFVSRVLNKETFVSMEPIESLIKHKTSKIYMEIQDRENDFEYPKIIGAILDQEGDFEDISTLVLNMFKSKEEDMIRQMINAITKSTFDTLKEDSFIKHS